MQENQYKIFGLTADASNDEVDERYKTLREKYRNDMFLEGELGNEAAKKLTQLENAYAEVLSNRTFNAEKKEAEDYNGKDEDIYVKIEALIKADQINEAQELLDNIKVRDGKWHYHQANVFFKKDWFTDCKKQLETAVSMEPTNEKYKTSLNKLNKLMSGKSEPNTADKKKVEEWWKEKEHPNDSNSPDWDDNNRQMGGCNHTLSCCGDILCANLLCNCLGGGC